MANSHRDVACFLWSDPHPVVSFLGCWPLERLTNKLLDVCPLKGQIPDCTPRPELLICSCLIFLFCTCQKVFRLVLAFVPKSCEHCRQLEMKKNMSSIWLSYNVALHYFRFATHLFSLKGIIIKRRRKTLSTIYV